MGNKVSKVVYDDRVLLDISNDTVTADKLLKGTTAHGSDGEEITGTCEFDTKTKVESNAASASEILAGQVAFVNETYLEGTMPNRGKWVGTLSSTAAVTIPSGYHDGTGSIGIGDTDKTNIIAKNIRSGKTILGVTGTMSPTEGVNAQSVTVTPSPTVQQEITPDVELEYNYLSKVTVEKIRYEEVSNGKGMTAKIACYES